MSTDRLNAYEILYRKVQPIIDCDTTNIDEIELSGNCDYCLRGESDTGGVGVIWNDSYGSQNNICKTCNLFVEQLPTVLGYERGPIGYKFSSFKSGYLAVPNDANRAVELWVGGKYLDRVKTDKGLSIIDITGNQAKYELCERIGEYSVVVEISLRREMFLRHVKKSSNNTLFIATETGVVSLSKNHYKALKSAFIKENLSNKEFNNAVVIINSIKSGRMDMGSKDAQALLGGLSKGLLLAIKDIADPLSIVFMLAGLKVGLIKDEDAK